MRLRDRIALVTGGARGLGFATVKRLAEEGATVVIADITECADRIEQMGEVRDRIVFRHTDIRHDESVETTVRSILQDFDRIDILINNAAIFSTLERKPLEEIEAGEWEDVFAVNVLGCFRCIRSVVPAMKAQGGGKIINVASNVVFKGLPLLLHYVSSKGAVFAMTRAAAKELGEHNINVNAVAPGYMRHDDFANWDEHRDQQVTRIRSLARTQSPDDVVGTIAFLACDDSDFITGQTLVVDGGEVFN